MGIKIFHKKIAVEKYRQKTKIPNNSRIFLTLNH